MNLPLTRAGSAGAGVAYLFKDEFTTDESAPIADPRTCEPGPGTLDIYDATGALVEITGGKLSINPTNWGTAQVYGNTAIARVAGRLLMWDHYRGHQGNLTIWCGDAFTPGTGIDAAYRDVGIWDYSALWSSYYGHQNNRIIQPWKLSTGSWYEFAIVLRATGSFTYMKGGAFADWYLLSSTRSGTHTNLHFWTEGWNGNDKKDRVRVPDALWVPTPIASDSFVRGDGSDVGDTDGAGSEENTQASALTWVEQSGNWEIASNNLESEGASPGDPDWLIVVDASADQVLIEFGIPDAPVSASAIVGCVLKWAADDSHGFICVEDYGASEKAIYEWDGASYTNRATGSHSVHTRSWVAFCEDDDITFKGFWSYYQCSYTNASIDNSETRHGLYTDSPDEKFDFFALFNREESNFPDY